MFSDKERIDDLNNIVPRLMRDNMRYFTTQKEVVRFIKNYLFLKYLKNSLSGEMIIFVLLPFKLVS
ncbi:MAG: hypothetical protein ACJATL_000746 [Rickettsiales bacterium]|jgi:hypothetical protein